MHRARGSRIARWRDDDGETLVELLVSVAILGVAGVAIVSGMLLSVKSSDVGRKQATGGAYVRSFAEAIQNSVDDAGGYPGCGAAAAAYGSVSVPDLPSGYSPSVVSVQSWTGSTWGSCDDKGIQRVSLKVTSPITTSGKAEETLTVVLRRPCNGSASTAGDQPCGP